MTPDEVRALIAQHKGLSGHEIIDKPKKATYPGTTIQKLDPTTGQPTGELAPLEQNPRIKYNLGDGTHFTARQNDDGSYTVIDNGTAIGKTAVAKPRVKTFPDGSLREEDPSAPDGWRVIAEKPAHAPSPVSTSANEPNIVTRSPDGSIKTEPNPNYVPPKSDVPGLNLGQRRPGQRTDLSLVEQQANAYLAQLNADVQAGKITRDDRQRQWDAYVATTVKPLVDQANKETADYADEQLQRQRANEARANAREDRLAANDTRRASTDQQRLDFDRQRFAQEAGQTAVTNARAANKEILGSGQFGQHLADFLSGGAGTMPRFTAEDLQHPQPDYDAIAERAVQKALAAVGYGGGAPSTADALHGMFGTSPQAAPAVPMAAAPAAPAATPSGVPPAPPPAPPPPVNPPVLPQFPGMAG